MKRKSVALRIDVSSSTGVEIGVPALLELLARYGVRATFYVALGPDNGGRALRRILTVPGCFSRFLRMRPYALPGIKRLLYGTLIPAPVIAESFPEQLQSIRQAGHEVGIHAWDHRKWMEYLPWFPKHLTAMELGRASARFEEIYGHRALTAAAPGWTVTPDSLEVQDAMGLEYCSDCRGSYPFYPVMGGRRFRTPQIPVTLPPADELLGLNGVTAADLPEFYARRLSDDLNVLAVRAELEGCRLRDAFGRLLQRFADDGVSCTTLGEVFRSLASVPACRVAMQRVPGGAGLVAVQGREVP